MPVFAPHCPRPHCRVVRSWRDSLLLNRCHTCNSLAGFRTWSLLPVSIAFSIYIWYFPPNNLHYIGGITVLFYLLLVGIIDLEHHLILRPLSITGILLGGGAGLLMHGWKSMLIGGIAGCTIMLFFYYLGKLFNRIRSQRSGIPATEDALGSGDVTLATILGLLLGWPLIWFDILLGMVIAGVISIIIIAIMFISRQYSKNAFSVFIPLGPGFIIAAIVLIYFPQYIAAILSP